MRIRVPLATAGTTIGVREAARKYGIPNKTISQWGIAGEVTVLARPEKRGGAVLLDELSLQKRIKDYTPHRDGKGRHIRTRPTPATPTAPNTSHPHRVGGPLSLPSSGSSSPLTPRPPGRVGIVVRPLPMAYKTRELADRFLASKKGGGRSKVTLENLRWSLKPFWEAFPELPVERHVIARHIQSQPGLPATVGSHHKNIRNFYHWLADNNLAPSIDLARLDLPRNRRIPVSFTQEEIGRVLSACKDAVERAAVIVEAQSAMRRGEFCSIRRENLRDGWVMVNGKEGERVAYLPREAMNALVMAMAGKDRIYHHGVPLSVDSEKKMMNHLLKRAGVWKRGVGNHAFRHSWEAEYLLNGGNEAYMNGITGHKDKSMREHYLHVAHADLQAEAERCAPRRFLQLNMALAVAS